MRRWMAAAAGGLMVTACGGGGGSGSGAVEVVSGTPAPAPSPTPSATSSPAPAPAPSPTATAAPTPAPTPSYAYPRFAELTGNRNFDTACASVVLGAGLPTPQPATGFGDGLTLAYAAAASWAVSGDGVNLSFAAADAVAATTGQRAYERTASGVTQRLVIVEPSAAGSALEFTRALTLRAERATGPTLYSCVFGVPVTLTDKPKAAVTYGKVGVTGTAFIADPAGLQTYTLTASTGTVSFDPTANAIVVKVRLLGQLQTAGGTASATTELGTFTGTGALDATRPKFSGQLDSSDRVSLFSSFGGWFFGDTEAASAFEILAADPATGNRVSMIGTIAAAR